MDCRLTKNRNAVNGWEFRRNQLEDNSYSHPLFLRDNAEECLKMVRTTAAKNKTGVAVTSQEGQRTKKRQQTEQEDDYDASRGEGRKKK